MISTLHISRFKSIKELTLNCRRINLFIGEPNTGKSNILETLGLVSFLYYYRFGKGDMARRFFRFVRTSNLFYDEMLDEPVEINFDDMSFGLSYKDGRFLGECIDAGHSEGKFDGDHNNISVSSSRSGKLDLFKFYRFSVQEEFPRQESEFLLPPSGNNLLSLLVSNRELRSVVNRPFLAMGLRLGLRPSEGKIEEIKSVDDVIVSYPYSLVSETLQRLTFYQAAILSNKNSILVFEEPESHSFPYHTKYLAEQIALDENDNQYFIATHNPYFLLPVLEKAGKENVSVHIVYYEDYQTKTKELSPDDLSELAEIDVFSNLDRYLEAN